MKFNINDTKIQIAIAAVVLIILAVGAFFYFNSQVGQNAQDENRKVIAEVLKLMDLPTQEDPTIATITDINKLKDQPFFQKAKNGDKVLIYAGARKAILYDPQAKKIMDVTIINVGTPSAGSTTLTTGPLGTGPSGQIATPAASPR